MIQEQNKTKEVKYIRFIVSGLSKDAGGHARITSGFPPVLFLNENCEVYNK